MRCVVTGAAGFIGSHLVERLLNEGHHVVGLDNFITGQRANISLLERFESFTFIEHDICEPLSIRGSVEIVFNLACPASPVDFRSSAIQIMRVCSEGVLLMLKLAREKNSVFVQASTSECYGDPFVHPQPESFWGYVNPIGERSPYDEGKRFAEALIMAHRRLYGMETRIARIFNTYGPRMRLGDGRVLPNFIQQALENKPLSVYGEGDQTRSFCYVTDLVDGLVRLSRSSEPYPINIGNPHEVTISEIAREIIELTASRSEIAFQPLPEDDPKLRQPDITRAQKLLTWEPTTNRSEGFRKTIEYFRTLLDQSPSNR